MILLILLSATPERELLISFTFHYDSINSVQTVISKLKKIEFTFHYDSINSVKAKVRKSKIKDIYISL